jgi:hypothetical protein
MADLHLVHFIRNSYSSVNSASYFFIIFVRHIIFLLIKNNIKVDSILSGKSGQN